MQPNNANTIHNPNIHQQYIYTSDKSPKGKENGTYERRELEDQTGARGSVKKEAVASTKTLKKNHSANNLNSAGLLGRKYSASGEIKFNGTARVSSYSKLQNPDHVQHQAGNSKSNPKDPSLKNLVSSEIKKSLAKKKSAATLITQN